MTSNVTATEHNLTVCHGCKKAVRKDGHTIICSSDGGNGRSIITISKSGDCPEKKHIENDGSDLAVRTVSSFGITISKEEAEKREKLRKPVCMSCTYFKELVELQSVVVCAHPRLCCGSRIHILHSICPAEKW